MEKKIIIPESVTMHSSEEEQFLEVVDKETGKVYRFKNPVVTGFENKNSEPVPPEGLKVTLKWSDMKKGSDTNGET